MSSLVGDSQLLNEELHFNPETKNGVVIGGMTFPPKQPRGIPWKTHIESIRNLQLRENDVFLCAYPKAGTHWLWEMIHMLLTGTKDYEVRTKESLMMEFMTKESIDATPSPRVLNTHLPFSLLPVGVMKEVGARVVHVYRNPKDTLVSMYFHFVQTFPFLKEYTLRQFMDLFLKEDMVYGNYFNYLKQMETFVKDNPDVPVIQLSYEDLKKKDLPEQIAQLGRFLGVETSEEFCADIASACSFHQMKKADQSKQLPDISPHTMSKETSLYRKGQVGDWKNYLTVRMNELMDAAIQDNLAGSSYKLQFT